MAETECPIPGVEVVADGEFCVAQFATPASQCGTCSGREGQFARDDEGYEVFQPCDRRQARRRMDLFNSARIGRRFAGATFESYRPGPVSQARALETARLFTSTYATGRGARGGLLFWGPVGTGKTHLALSIFRSLTLDYGIPCRFVDYGNLLMDLRRSFRAEAGTSEAALMLPLVETEVLIVDELGKGRDTEWELTVLDDLISRRYNADRITLFTTNLSVQANRRTTGKGLNPAYDRRQVDSTRGGAPSLEERLDARIYSRLCEMCDFIKVEGDDFRRTGLAVSRRRP
ncbi:MAG: ATP-binding protein [Deltaproteobacteria bacterium]|nr:ATP-binding protein [Deltaproteobacteria bacterium]